MAGTLDFLLGKRTDRSCDRYADAFALFGGLEREEPAAIRCLYGRASGIIHQVGRDAGLTDEDIEELICDCITIGIQKIRSGKFVFQGYAPATYIVEIAKNRAQNFRRKQIRHHTEALDGTLEKAAEEEEFGALEAVELMEQLLSQLDSNCEKLIRLKYLEERKDKEVIAEALTQYSTVDALKNHRSRCLKKLTELAQAIKQKHV
jgi:DNA-directed RNA polymerase specialized sigma24 family protein